jgi:hypothetical protein
LKLSKLRVLICCLACLPAVLTLACGQRPATPPAPAPPTAAPAIEPVKFEPLSIKVNPQEIEASEAAQAVVSVKNSGSARNAYVGTLYVDGNEYLTQAINIEPGQVGTLIFVVSNLNQGTHRLTMAGLESSLRVYSVEKYTLTNNKVFLPHYTNLESTPVPSVPHISSDTFSPPVTPFYITRINFQYPFPQSFTILDENNRQIYSSGITNMDSAFVPGIEVRGNFTIEMQTNQPVADIRLQYFNLYTYTYSYVISYFWPEVSTVEGIQKRFGP